MTTTWRKGAREEKATLLFETVPQFRFFLKDHLNKFGVESGECAFAPWAHQAAKKESQCVLEDEQDQVAHAVLNYLVARQNTCGKASEKESHCLCFVDVTA